MRTQYAAEYRINKKGAECFRATSYEVAKLKLDELNAKRPIYTMQCRTVQVDRYGVKAADSSGNIIWSCWR